MKILIISTNDNCRSQMAKTFLQSFDKSLKVFSAGTDSMEIVNPFAIRVMQEIGIDIHGHHSKSVEEFRGQKFDQIITVCDSAAEDCPLWLGKGQHTHIGFEDPARVTGSEVLQLRVFRQCREQIRQRVLGYLQQINATKE